MNILFPGGYDRQRAQTQAQRQQAQAQRQQAQAQRPLLGTREREKAMLQGGNNGQ
jgi:hypothetical protein